MKENFILIERSRLVENTISPYDNSNYDMEKLVNSILAKGLAYPIKVCPLPGTHMFEIVDGNMRDRAYGIIGRTDIECSILDILESEKPSTIIDLNIYREKSFADKLEEGLLLLNSILPEPGKRNDLAGNSAGKTRTEIAGEKVGVSASSIEKYAKVKEMNTKYPDRKILQTFKSGEKSLTKIHEEELTNDKKTNEILANELEQMAGKFTEFENTIQNPPQPYVLPIADAKHFCTENFSIYNKPSQLMGDENEIPKGVLKTFLTSFPYLSQATYNEDNPDELGHEETVEAFLANLKPIMLRVFENMSPGESFFVNMNDTYKWNKDNIIPEEFVRMMTKELGYHKHATMIFQKTNTTMKGSLDKRPYNSWEYLYWFVKDMNTFQKDSGNFYNNIKFYDEKKNVQFGRYGGRKNADGSKTKFKIYFEKPYKRFHDFINEQEFLDTLCVSNSGSDNALLKKLYGFSHPCPYSLVVPLYPILFCSKPDSIIIDPFMGSGTTLATALLMGRKAIGYEIEPKFFDLSKQRLLDICKEANPHQAQIIEANFNEKWNNKAA